MCSPADLSCENGTLPLFSLHCLEGQFSSNKFVFRELRFRIRQRMDAVTAYFRRFSCSRGLLQPRMTTCGTKGHVLQSLFLKGLQRVESTV